MHHTRTSVLNHVSTCIIIANKGLCNNYLEGGGGEKIRGVGIGENDNKREGVGNRI